MANKRSSYPFHIMLGRAPAEGERRTYQVITTKEEACSSTSGAESLINKMIKEKRVEIEEGDHLVVAQITRVRALKTVRKVSQVDEDPNDAFGTTAQTPPDDESGEEELEVEEGEVSDPAEEPAEEQTEEPEATSEVTLPDETAVPAANSPAPPPPPAPAVDKKPAVPPAATPPPSGQTTEEEEDDDPLADMEPAVEEIVDDSGEEPAVAAEPAAAAEPAKETKSEEAPAADKTGESDDPLDEIF